MYVKMYTSFCGICSLFILCLKLLFPQCVTYVLGCYFIKTCSLTSIFVLIFKQFPKDIKLYKLHFCDSKILLFQILRVPVFLGSWLTTLRFPVSVSVVGYTYRLVFDWRPSNSVRFPLKSWKSKETARWVCRSRN